ncbi:MAG: DUF2452 domain-containing protein [Bacteroidota bacterium]
MKSEEEDIEFVNPIDADKIAENPHSLPYAHNVGSPIIKPIDKGKVKGRAMQAMVEQTGDQMERIREQIELLASQARDIQKRVEVSTRIYEAAVGFEPLIHQTYHLYERENGEWVLSLVGPNEWGRSNPFPVFISSVRLLADHTWELKDVNDDAI